MKSPFSRQSAPSRFRVGDMVVLPTFRGPAPYVGQVVEVQGPTGVGGRRFYTVRIPITDGVTDDVTLREDYLEPVEGKDETPPGKP